MKNWIKFNETLNDVKPTYKEQIQNTLNKILKINKGHDLEKDASLFDLRTIRPNHTDEIKYVKLGSLLGKKYFNKYQEAVLRDLGFKPDGAVHSRLCVEVSNLDNEPHIEISLNKKCQLPIAGSQYYVLDREAKNQEISLEGYIDSLNFILNDERNF